MDDARGALDAVYRAESRRVLAALVRLLGGFDAAEEALHEAFAAAAASWPNAGLPANPYAWLVSAGRNRVVDRWRREKRAAALLAALPPEPDEPPTPEAIRDDELRRIFICCHPKLSPDGRVALTLREVGGLLTEEIARAYLVPAPTIAQRIVRAKAKIRDLRLPYEVPAPAEWPERLESVLQVIYLIFYEGFSASHGPDLVRRDLCRDAIRLGRLLCELTGDAEAYGQLALMLLHDARSRTRADVDGRFVALEHQDRSLWDRERIAEAQGLIAKALTGRIGAYTIQAAIADLHARASRFEDTDWPQIVALYDSLLRVAPSPVVALNRAAAIGQRDGPEAGLAAVDAVIANGGLDRYHLAFAARADMLRRVGRTAEASCAYAQALALARQPAERAFLEQRMAELS